ncbi:MAG: universal stress protein [Rhodospirillales bacterium]|nr:universal stress protein [Rhodospirillales bacterium]
MAETDVEFEEIYRARKARFRVLVCIDGSDDSYLGLNYAADVARGPNADIILLFVRPLDQGMRTGGLQVRVARENMLNWGLELPGMQYLKKGRDRLLEDPELPSEWGEETTHTDVEGDPLGDNKIEYQDASGKSIVLKVKTAPSIAAGILDQYELGPYDLIILGGSGRWGGRGISLWDPAVAEKIAVHSPCSVLVTRELKGGKGHLLCTDGSERAMEMVRKAAGLINKTKAGHLSILSVALDETGEAEAKANVEKAASLVRSLGVEPRSTFTRIGNPVEEIIKAGSEYSIIVTGDTGKSGIQRFFMGSVAFKVMEFAKNSVMVVR